MHCQHRKSFQYFLQFCVQLLIFNFIFYGASGTITQDTFKAAVLDKGNITYYTNDTVPTRQEALELVRPHLELYAQAAEEASQQVRQLFHCFLPLPSISPSPFSKVLISFLSPFF